MHSFQENTLVLNLLNPAPNILFSIKVPNFHVLTVFQKSFFPWVTAMHQTALVSIEKFGWVKALWRSWVRIPLKAHFYFGFLMSLLISILCLHAKTVVKKTQVDLKSNGDACCEILAFFPPKKAKREPWPPFFGRWEGGLTSGYVWMSYACAWAWWLLGYVWTWWSRESRISTSVRCLGFQL